MIYQNYTQLTIQPFPLYKRKRRSEEKRKQILEGLERRTSFTNSAAGKFRFMLTHNREYWNASLSVSRRRRE